MATIFNPTLQEIALAAVNQKVLLDGVGWDFYEQVLAEYAESNALHFAYDNGILEVKVPLWEHERPARILQDIVSNVCFELGIEFANAGSTTFRQRAKAKGCEPDTAFYIQHEAAVRGLPKLDLRRDPPPDLVIEVDITSPSLNKLPIYAALGVPEIWLYRGERVTFHRLTGDAYEEITHSRALPALDSRTATEFLQQGLTESSAVWFRRLRAWAAAQP